MSNVQKCVVDGGNCGAGGYCDPCVQFEPSHVSQPVGEVRGSIENSYLYLYPNANIDLGSMVYAAAQPCTERDYIQVVNCMDVAKLELSKANQIKDSAIEDRSNVIANLREEIEALRLAQLRMGLEHATTKRCLTQSEDAAIELATKYDSVVLEKDMLRSSIYTVCEGCNINGIARKILEKAMWGI